MARYDQDELLAQWRRWQERLTGDEPFSFRAERRTSVSAEVQQAECTAICDGAAWQLWQDTVNRSEREVDRPTEHLDEAADLVNVEWNMVARMLKVLAEKGLAPGQFKTASRETIKDYWRTKARFSEVMIRYLLRPDVYLRSFREWSREMTEVLAEARDFPAMVLQASDMYMKTVVADDPIRAVANIVAYSAPNNPLVRAAMTQLHSLQIQELGALLRDLRRLDERNKGLPERDDPWDLSMGSPPWKLTLDGAETQFRLLGESGLSHQLRATIEYLVREEARPSFEDPWG